MRGLTFEELVHLLADLEEHVHGWGVVVLPLVLQHHALELLVVVLPAAQVEDQVRVTVSLLQERSHLQK